MNKTAEGLVTFVKKCVGRPYIYATYGKILTEVGLAWCVKNYPNRFSDYRIRYAKEHYLGKRTDDCEGLIKNYLFCDPNNPNPDSNSDPTYKASMDVSANGAFELATVKGDISTMPDKPGICVHKNGHVGVYIGRDSNNRKLVCEAQGFDYGVRINLLVDRPFVHWFEHPWIDYSNTPTPTPDPKGDKCTVETTVLRKGMKGLTCIGRFQMLMNDLGITDDDGNKLAVDNSFGKRSEQACIRFQKKNGLTADGICGSKTWSKIING